MLQEVFRIFSFIEGICINILVLQDKIICYNEDSLRKEFLNEKNKLALTKEGLEHILKLDYQK